VDQILQIIFTANVIFTLIKTIVYQFEPSQPLAYAMVVVSILAVALEILLWKALLKRKTLTSSNGNKGEHLWRPTDYHTGDQNHNYAYKSPRGNSGEPLRINAEDDRRSMISESEFHSADEISDSEFEESQRKGSIRRPPTHHIDGNDQILVDRLKEAFPEFPEEKLHRFLQFRKLDYVPFSSLLPCSFRLNSSLSLSLFLANRTLRMRP